MHKLWRITIDTNPEDCNLNCIMCEEHSPYSNFISKLYENSRVKRRVMPLEWIDKIFIQAKELGIKEIIPSTMGEPLLYKHFEKIIELCKRHEIKLNLTTNGTFPRKSVKEWANLIVPITSDVKISWNGYSKKIAETVMVGINFEKALENLKEFINVRNEYFKETNNFCRVTLQLTFMKNNMPELSEIIKLAAELDIDRVKGHHLWAHFPEIQDLSFRKDTESIDKWNQYVESAYINQKKILKPNGKQVILENIIPLKKQEVDEVPETYECPFLNRELWISATGKISPCCAPDNERKALGDFGNIQETSLINVIQSESYQNLVNNYKKIPLCKTCNMRKP